MYRYAIVFSLFLLFHTPVKANELAEGDSMITGTYLSANPKGYKVVIDEADRLTTNIEVKSMDGVRLPIVFPHRVKYDAKLDRFVAYGYFRVTQFPNGQKANCQYPVTFLLDVYGDGKYMDVDMRMHERFFLDQFGVCRAVGGRSYPFSFNRMEE